MGIEGLDYILNKQEVVPTVSASDLLYYAERVEDDYNRHVRTYVPINRAAEGREGTLSVEAFEQKIIKAVKNAKAPRGYLTAEYGYGKTSTALYLWKRAEEENLIVVPPFQMLHLPDLVTAIHGWTRYRLSVHSPNLVPYLDELYHNTTNRSLEQEARNSKVSVAQLEEWVRQGKFNLDLQPADFIQYFEQVTAIVLEAGFDGLLVLADEIQQYIEPRIKSSNDPIAPLFNLIQMLLTRENRLKFGLILIIGLKEVGLIRETRNDLLHRMREISLDLTNVYDYEFALRLWQLLAREFDFKDISSDITTPEALEALGEIASRTDLSDGPRTVINTFRRMVERYKTYGISVAPYSPIDLIDDLLNGSIQFAGNNQIQNIARLVLQSDIVRSAPEYYTPAIKLAAAYPASGVPFRTQQKYGVDDALDELMRIAIGELVINVGLPENRGVTLFGLHSGVQKTDWLSQTIRDFRRSYGEHHDSTRQRAIKMFTRIVKDVLFKNWKVLDERPSTFTSNHSIILQGDYQAFAAKFPRRKVHVRIFWEDEERKDATDDGDIAIEYYLTLRTDLQEDPDERRKAAYPLIREYDNHRVMLQINLLYVRDEGIPPHIATLLEGVWSPYDLSPLVLMSIYEMLEEKRADKLIPQQDDQFIKTSLQVELLYNIARDLFNATIGEPFGGVSQGRITEIAVEELLDYRFGNTYRTLMTQSNWSNTLTRYSNAIKQLDNLYQRRGEVEYEGTKEEIARLFSYTNTAFDNFVKTFGGFIEVTREWRGNSSGAVRFRLHELEQHIIHWLKNSDQMEKVALGNKTSEVHAINESSVYEQSRILGYQDDEIEALIRLLIDREMIEHQRYLIREVPSQNVDLDNVAIHLSEFRQEVTSLLKGFPDNNQLVELQAQIDAWQIALEKERQSGTPDPQRVYKLSRNIQVRREDLRKIALDIFNNIKKQIGMLRRNLRPINQQHLGYLSTPIEGSITYVDQVNVLRTQLRNHANNIKGRVDLANTRIETIENILQKPDMSYEDLASCAHTTSDLDKELQAANEGVVDFEEHYRHLSDWQRLVNDGSQLLNEMQLMGHLASDYHDDFDRLSRDIRGDISSKSNKLLALPNHSIYAPQLSALLQQVRTVRRNAEDGFVNLQNQYYRLFTDNGLYTREKLGRPFEYNISNPEESYRLLYERIQKLAIDLHAQIRRITRDRSQNIHNVLNTPLFDELPETDRVRLEQEGRSLMGSANDSLNQLDDLEKYIKDISVIRDFTVDGDGRFTNIVETLVETRDASRSLAEGDRQLSQWLAEIRLSPEEETLMAHLRSEDLDTTIDILDWQKSTKLSSDEFWNLVRTLYEKHRVRILIARVRR